MYIGVALFSRQLVRSDPENHIDCRLLLSVASPLLSYRISSRSQQLLRSRPASNPTPPHPKGVSPSFLAPLALLPLSSLSTPKLEPESVRGIVRRPFIRLRTFRILCTPGPPGRLFSRRRVRSTCSGRCSWNPRIRLWDISTMRLLRLSSQVEYTY